MNLFERLYNKYIDKSFSVQKQSYSQCGEDLIVDFLFTWVLNIKNPSFMDVGAHHPWYLSNTYLMYRKGSTGVNIEPDPYLFSSFPKLRKRDININKGVAFNTTSMEADFYIMSSRVLNTFSKSEATRVSGQGNVSIEEIKKIELVNINDLFKKFYSEKELDFLSIDVEGLDLNILNTIEFEQNKPKVICVETLEYAEQRIIKKNTETIDFLKSRDYFVYADTSINTIFARKDLF